LQLKCASAKNWQEREKYFSVAFEHVAKAHNALNITPPLETSVSNFFSRPYKVIWGGRFADAICATVTDSKVKKLAARRRIGGIDQWSDCTDISCESTELQQKLAAVLYS